jgi:hypothetical protein
MNNRLIKTAPTKELRDLFYMMMNSPPLSEEQSAYVNEIVDEIEKREKSPYTIEDYSYLRIFEKYDLIKETLPAKTTPIEVILAVFEHSTDEELQRLRAGFMGIGDYYRETTEAFTEQGENLTGRDADPPRVKPKPRRKLHPALIAACIAAALFLASTVTAYATGFNLFSMLARWTNDAVYFIRGTPTENVKKMDVAYVRLGDTLDALGIKVDLPRYMPKGFDFDAIEPDEPTEFSDIVAWFVRGSDEFYIRVKRMEPDVAAFSEINNEEESEVYRGKYLIASNMSRMVAIWHDGDYEIRIQGNLPYEELTQILDSI